MSENRHTLGEYLDAITYRNKDKANGKLGKGIVIVAQKYRKKGSKKGLGLIKSIIAEFVQFEMVDVNGEQKLAVTKINMPKDLQPAFLSSNRPYSSSHKEK